MAYALALPIPISTPWTVLIVGLALWLALTILDFKIGEARVVTVKSLWQAPLAPAFVAFAAATTLSGLFSGGPLDAIESFWTLRAILVYFWAYQSFLRDPASKPYVVVCLVVSGAIAGLWATIQQKFGIHLGSFHFAAGTGFLASPMSFSGQMQLFLLLGLGIAFKQAQDALPRPFNNRVLLYCLLALNAFGLASSQERSAWLGGSISLLGTACLVSLKVAGFALLSLLAALAVSWLWIPHFADRIINLQFWYQDPSIQARFKIWNEAWKLFVNNPVLGVGIRHFPQFDIPEASVLGRFLVHAHSNYLHILATGGVIGFAAYVWLIGAMLYASWKRRSGQDRFTEALALGIFAGTISLMVAGLFEYNFGAGQVRLTQWFILAMLGPLTVAQTKTDH